ncbi:MAG: hypothetical protein AAF376_14480 [Pseudomonadota bacterium]
MTAKVVKGDEQSMSKLSFKASIFAFFCCVLMPLHVSAQETQIPVEDDFVVYDVNFTGELGTVYQAMWTARIHEDRVMICGIGALRSDRLRSTIRRMARDGQIRVDGQEYDVNLTFFTRASTPSAMRSGMANCQLTSAPAPQAGGVQLRFGYGRIRM